MIKVYSLKDFNNEDELIKVIANDSDLWDFPKEELLYLTQEHNGENFLFVGNRFLEINDEILNKFKKESE